MSKLKSLELVRNPDLSFSDCKLDREKYADALTSILNVGSDGFVLALNNKWGTGKTTFVKMWQAKLILQDYQTLYFNAWENDFDNDALTALISKLKNIVDENSINLEGKLKSLMKTASIFAKKLVPVLVKAVIDKHVVETEIIIDAYKATSEAMTELFDEQVNDYIEKEKSLIEFKTQLCEIIKEISVDKPIVFFIDELDRCRPNYAVEVLEKVKHFFNIDRIVFVLVIDKEHLSKSICGYYGNNEINTDEYLRRFIDIEFSLPETDIEVFLTYLFNSYYIDIITKREIDYPNISSLLLNFFKNSGMNLRQIEKAYIHLSLILHSFSHRFVAYFPYIITLFLIKLNDQQLFNQIIGSKLDIRNFQVSIQNFLKPYLKTTGLKTIINEIEASLLILYNFNLSDGMSDSNLISDGRPYILNHDLKSLITCDLQESYKIIKNQTNLVNGKYFNQILDLINLYNNIKSVK